MPCKSSPPPDYSVRSAHTTRSATSLSRGVAGRRDRHGGRGSLSAVPNARITNTAHNHCQPAPRLGADETHAPKARRLVHRGHTGESLGPLRGPTFAGEVGGAGLE